jgi:hypothetical protein
MQPLRDPEEPVCIDLFWQKPVFTSLHLKYPVHVVPPQASVFSRPVCEVLLNQQYFNGIGNYLRAEILFRAGIPPFQRNDHCCRRSFSKPSILLIKGTAFAPFSRQLT